MRSIQLIIIVCFFVLVAQASAAQYILPAPKNGPVYVIAHRGAHMDIPENSLPAYQKAIDLGCDFIEIDVRTTRDDQLVSIHNATIDACVKGATGTVRELTLAQLKQIDIGLKVGEKWKNTSIPTLEEILQLCSGKIGIYLDLKDGDPGQIIALLKKYNMESRTVWYLPASRHKTLMEIKQYCDACLIMPDPGPSTNLESVFAAYNPKVIASDMNHFNKEFSQKVQERQAIVFVDENAVDSSLLLKQWQQLIEWGADGIQTDDPERLIGYLKN